MTDSTTPPVHIPAAQPSAEPPDIDQQVRDVSAGIVIPPHDPEVVRAVREALLFRAARTLVQSLDDAMAYNLRLSVNVRQDIDDLRGALDASEAKGCGR